ncbi:MAG: hypothetical protein RI564_11485 [Gracilimonas sp.]|nr:hypothetical protein [Gracilimonas sp.]
MFKKKKLKTELGEKTQKKWKHTASKIEANALRAMMQKNANSFKKKIDNKAMNEEEDL